MVNINDLTVGDVITHYLCPECKAETMPATTVVGTEGREVLHLIEYDEGGCMVCELAAE